ncbi:hypothetical protein BDV98DRAFT_608955 [Pterulicium gracile]|uniref:Cytochrome P450 n=1 Tax=Pterulicium gracile TaxID=1884261 RepID=A0A5C3Q2S4_9AGAR|nr:hypothetical protein BDV98DRAFT_608955 [Pterula gracilis]
MLHAFGLIVETTITPGWSCAGHLKSMFSPHAIPWHLEMLRIFGKAFKIYTWLGLYVTGPLALHHIVIKDQSIFEETTTFIQGNRLAFGHGLLGALGDTHRKQRKILNPVFSNAQMRNFAPIFYSLSYQKIISTSQFTEGNMRPWISKIALEIIGEADFG